MQFLSYLARGISLGSVYALIALGYTMVYGIAKMLNFAHGDVIMVGGYVVFFTFCKGGIHPVLAIIIAMGACTLLGITIDSAEICSCPPKRTRGFSFTTEVKDFGSDFHRSMAPFCRK